MTKDRSCAAPAMPVNVANIVHKYVCSLLVPLMHAGASITANSSNLLPTSAFLNGAACSVGIPNNISSEPTTSLAY